MVIDTFTASALTGRNGEWRRGHDLPARITMMEPCGLPIAKSVKVSVDRVFGMSCCGGGGGFGDDIGKAGDKLGEDVDVVDAVSGAGGNVDDMADGQ